MEVDLVVKNYVMDDGERYCLLIDSVSGQPLFHPNLFVTTQVRNKSLSLSAMQAALSAIKVLLIYMAEAKESLELRFTTKRFL